MSAEIRLGVGPEPIAAAEQQLGVAFPGELKAIWSVYNGLELSSGWLLHPVFDPANPRKTCNSIVYENTPGKGRWDYMSDDLIAIAGDGSGDQLVLRQQSGVLSPQVLVWEHEENATCDWEETLGDFLVEAKARVEAIQRRAKPKRDR